MNNTLLEASGLRRIKARCLKNLNDTIYSQFVGPRKVPNEIAVIDHWPGAREAPARLAVCQPRHGAHDSARSSRRFELYFDERLN